MYARAGWNKELLTPRRCALLPAAKKQNREKDEKKEPKSPGMGAKQRGGLEPADPVGSERKGWQKE